MTANKELTHLLWQLVFATKYVVSECYNSSHTNYIHDILLHIVILSINGIQRIFTMFCKAIK